jgi:hypothetical protein
VVPRQSTADSAGPEPVYEMDNFQSPQVRTYHGWLGRTLMLMSLYAAEQSLSAGEFLVYLLTCGGCLTDCTSEYGRHVSPLMGVR